MLRNLAQASFPGPFFTQIQIPAIVQKPCVSNIGTTRETPFGSGIGLIEGLLTAVCVAIALHRLPPLRVAGAKNPSHILSS